MSNIQSSIGKIEVKECNKVHKFQGLFYVNQRLITLVTLRPLCGYWVNLNAGLKSCKLNWYSILQTFKYPKEKERTIFLPTTECYYVLGSSYELHIGCIPHSKCCRSGDVSCVSGYLSHIMCSNWVEVILNFYPT